VVFVGINREESEYTIGVFLAQTGFAYPVLMDQNADVYNMYQLDGNISPFPLDYIIDRYGIVRYGATDYDPLDMRFTVDLLLAQCDSVLDLTSYEWDDGVRLIWSDWGYGEYHIFSTTDPIAPFPDNWSLEAVIPSGSASQASYVDQATLQMRKFYAVIRVCL